MRFLLAGNPAQLCAVECPMPLRRYFSWSLRLRAAPAILRWMGAVALVAISFGLRLALWGLTTETPFLCFFPAIILSAVLLDRASGFVATFLSAALALYFFLAPTHQIAIESTVDAVNLVLFCMIGCFVSFVVEALHAAYQEVEEAHLKEVALRHRAEAGERQREMLLQELRHRIKNDLARISSVIALHARRSSSETGAALQQAADRVQIIARLHDRFRDQDGHITIEISEFLGDLMKDIRSSLDELQPIGLFLKSDKFMVPVGTAGSVGLIMNELITNSLKHAFPDRDRECLVHVTLRRETETILMVVEDNGCGMAGDARPGTGMRLVRGLAAQLDGHIETTCPGIGTRHELRAPLNPASDLG